ASVGGRSCQLVPAVPERCHAQRFFDSFERNPYMWTIWGKQPKSRPVRGDSRSKGKFMGASGHAGTSAASFTINGVPHRIAVELAGGWMLSFGFRDILRQNSFPDSRGASFCLLQGTQTLDPYR